MYGVLKVPWIPRLLVVKQTHCKEVGANNEFSMLLNKVMTGGVRLTRSDYDSNNMGCSQIATNSNQAVPLRNPQPHSIQESRFGLVSHCQAEHTTYTAPSSFGQPSEVNNTLCQFPAIDQISQQDLLPSPQSGLTTTLNYPLVYSDTSDSSSSDFKQSLTDTGTLNAQGLEKPKPYPRQQTGRCIRCWALRKAVFLFV